MKRYGCILVEGIALVLLGFLLFRFPETSAEAARKGIRLCLDLLIPSLFPFFVLSSLVISTGLASACARPLEHLMGPLFGVGSPGAAALGLGLIGGYPVGARTIAQLVQRRECSQKEACRLSRFCNNCGPAFFIGAVGVGVFGEKKAGFLLLGANLAAALLVGIATRVTEGSLLHPCSHPVPSFSFSSLVTEFPRCVRDGFSATLGVCSYVILFSVLTALTEASGLLPLCTDALSSLFPGEYTNTLCRSFFIGLMELSTGTTALAEATASSLALPMAAFLLGWGGLSVHCQSLPFWQAAGVPMGPYLRAKFLQGILAAGITSLVLLAFPLALPAMTPILPLSSPFPHHQEIDLLWGLAGISFFLSSQKRMEKTKGTSYNKYIP